MFPLGKEEYPWDEAYVPHCILVVLDTRRAVVLNNAFYCAFCLLLPLFHAVLG